MGDMPSGQFYVDLENNGILSAPDKLQGNVTLRYETSASHRSVLIVSGTTLVILQLIGHSKFTGLVEIHFVKKIQLHRTARLVCNQDMGTRPA